MGGAGLRSPIQASSRAVREVQTRRSELGAALAALEHALLLDPEASAAWRLAVAGRVHDLSRAVAMHVGVTEGPGGLHDDITAGYPRLDHLVRRLQREHGAIRAELHEDERALAGPLDDEGVLRLRRDLLEMIERIRTHRQRGRELVHQAYDIDIGPGD